MNGTQDFREKKSNYILHTEAEEDNSAILINMGGSKTARSIEKQAIKLVNNYSTTSRAAAAVAGNSSSSNSNNT